ncbi:MAG TPA: ABC transporter substrate-binding protein [Candidatus Polarisedimenticolaceae bacterium]|nr:ABC transporter substrate-binding protein [Candidatus Polarisedimenticolaceae bacterium]
MKSFSRRLAAILVAALACACAAPRARHGNEVNLAFYSDPTSLSLIGNADLNSTQLASLISDGLIGYDAHGEYVPLVARSWEIAPDGLSITFHLRPGVVWHDGEPVTSSDVAYTFKKVRDPATQSRSWAAQFADVVAVDTPDPETAVARYGHPYADALDAWRVPLVPEHVASKDQDFLKGAFAQAPVGCGPFRFARRDPGQSIVLEAFDRYWGGKPRLDRVTFRVLANDRTAYEALLHGDLDVLGVPSDLWHESLTSARGAPLARFVYFRLNGWKIDWNMDGSNPFFTDPRVRRALVLALDRKRFADTIAGGLARPAVSSYQPESPWFDRQLSPLPYDPREAARLLDEAGWKLAPGKTVREKDGRPFAFKVLTGSGVELLDRIAAWTQESLAGVGVAMSIEKIDGRGLIERRKAHKFEAAMASNQFDPIADQFELYHSSENNGGMNYGSFSDPEVDRLVSEGRTTLDPGARRALYEQLQRRLLELQPISYLFQFAQPVLHDANLLGIEHSPVGLYAFVPGLRAWHWSDAAARP